MNNIMNKTNFRKRKAGIIPYIIENNSIKCLFMVPSNAEYGGYKPQIAKGSIDLDENSLQASIREGEEELGLRISNCKNIPTILWEGLSTGDDSTYYFTVYAVEVFTTDEFDQPHYETKYTQWLTCEQFDLHGRETHNVIVQQLSKHF